MRLLIALTITLTILIAVHPSPAVAAPDQQTPPVFYPADCMFDLPLGVVADIDVVCGYVSVPERHENPDGAAIDLAVVIIKSQHPNPAPDPLFMAQGGPGGSTIDTYAQLLLTRSRLRTNRDIVLWDQRGTLHSFPSLLCTEFLDATIETLDVQLTDEEIRQQSLNALQACRERLTRAGVDLSAFDSLQNAADIEALRMALGYEQINYYGVSYGTLLGLHYMELYPDGIRSAILDAVVPRQLNFLEHVPQNMYRSFKLLFDTCEQDTTCNRLYPNLEQVFLEVVDQLEENPARIQLTDTETFIDYEALLTGEDFLGAIFQLLYPTEYIPLLPKLIYDARDGDFRFLADVILPIIVFDRTQSSGMYFSVICAEDADFDPAGIDLSGLPEVIARYEARDLPLILELCELWEVEQLPASVDAPVSSDIPTLLLSGEFDPITPPRFADEAARTLTKAFVLTFPAGGHGAAVTGECQDSVILAFLDNPRVEPDTSCIATQEMGFITDRDILEVRSLHVLFGSDLNAFFITLGLIVVYLAAVLFLLSAFLLYPVMWFARRLQARPEQAGILETAGPAPSPSRLAQSGPWLAAFNGMVLTAFLVGMVVLIYQMIEGNNIVIYFGLPASAAPLLTLPLLALLLSLLMIVSAVARWRGSIGSLVGRIYYSLLALAALGAVSVLGALDLLTALF
jgi:pimeloyl-ACP methyl ester carboxylesterase